MAKVLSLFSGSLASRVATRLVEQHPDVDSVTLLHFRSPFSREGEELRQLVRAEWSHAVFRTQSIKKEYRRLLEITPEGRFSLAGSCRNCRLLLLSRAARYMERIGAEYIVSGELPDSLATEDRSETDELVGMTGKILRPLCVVRSRARGLNRWAGRDGKGMAPADGRAMLHRRAVDVGLDGADPMAACRRCKLLTPGFGERLASLFGETGFTLNTLRLLDFPLYFKVDAGIKIVLACDERERRELQNLFLPDDVRVYAATPHGPMTLVRAEWDARSRGEQQWIVKLAARITATVASMTRGESVPVYYRLEKEDETLLVNASPFRQIEEVAGLDRVEFIPLGGVPVLAG